MTLSSMFLSVLVLGFRRALSEEGAEAFPASQASLESSGAPAILDEAVSEALIEGACTVGVCLVVWAVGRAFGVTIRQPAKAKSASKKAKGNNKVTKVAPSFAAPTATTACSRSNSRTTTPTSSFKSSRASEELSVATTTSSLRKPAGDATGSSSFTRCVSNSSKGSGKDAEKDPRNRRATPTRSELAAETDKLAAAVRADRAFELPALFDAALVRLRNVGAPEPKDEQVAQLLLACLRACAAKRRFSEALSLYDSLSGYDGICRASTWSLLLWAAVEAHEFHRCSFFAEQLCEKGQPTGYDFANVVRYWAQTRDIPGFIRLLKRLVDNKCEIDLLARNRALAHCVTHRAFKLADAIVDFLPHVPMDPIAYNTLMKGYACEGNCEECFQLYLKMRSQGTEPTDITYGILLDACVDAKQLHRAREVFADIRRVGGRMNVVMYTTFIKGLVNAGELMEATGVLDEMSTTGKVSPDLVTYSTLVKAHSDAGNVWDAARLLDRMLKQGLMPDSVLYNIVLTGCCAKQMDASEIRCVLAWLVSRGLHPSTATFSVLVKALSQNNYWREALEELQNAQVNYGMWPESRVYVQLAQACAKAGYGKYTLGAYSALVSAIACTGEQLPEATHSRLCRLCASVGEGGAAAQLRASVTRAADYSSEKEIDSFLATAERVVTDVRRRAELKRFSVEWADE